MTTNLGQNYLAISVGHKTADMVLARLNSPLEFDWGGSLFRLVEECTSLWLHDQESQPFAGYRLKAGLWS